LIERGYGDLITPEYRIQSLLNRALGNQALNRFDQALIDAQQALKAARTAQDPQLHATALYAVGQSQLKLEQPVALETLEQAVTRFAALQPDPASPLALSYIKALIGLGTAKQSRNDIVGALSQFEQALALVTPTDRLTRAQILRSMGTAYQAQGNLTLALEKWAEALGLYEQANATVPMARLLCDIGVTRRQLLGLNAAIQSFERATMLLSSVKDLNTRGFVLSNVANLYTELGDIDTARSFYQEAIYLARQAANRRLESLRLGNLGWFNIMVGQPEEALRLLQEALQISQTLNDALMVAVQTSNLGLAQHDLKRFSDAEESFREAIRAAETVTDAFTEKRWEALFRSNLGRTLNAQQRYDEALEQLTQALSLSRAIGDQEITARVLVRMAEAYLQQGQPDLAEPLLHESELIARKIGYRRAEAECYVAQAALASARQDLTARDVALRNAQKTYQILHDPLARDLERTLEQASATPI
jgi:tetratricopeptide (TPR) repeat protein